MGHGAQRFLYRGMSAAQLRAKNLTTAHPWSPAPGEMVLDPASIKGLAIKPNCDARKGAPVPTICDPRLRTSNTQAVWPLTLTPTLNLTHTHTHTHTLTLPRTVSHTPTASTQAECGGAEDIYYYSPWRAPGAAPVIDPCGAAGGRFAGQA